MNKKMVCLLQSASMILMYFSFLYFICPVDPNVNEEQQNKKCISLIQESLVGYTETLTNKVFIHEGGIIELDSNDYRPICRIHIFLLNDLLILAKVKQNK